MSPQKLCNQVKAWPNPSFLYFFLLGALLIFSFSCRRTFLAVVRSYHELLGGHMDSEDLWDFLQSVPDSKGQAQGVTLGSLEVKKDRSKAVLKKTAHSGR